MANCQLMANHMDAAFTSVTIARGNVCFDVVNNSL